MGYYLVSTTTVSEFVAAMERMHIPQKIVIPVSVVFRFFPTVKEEYAAIRDAMKMRGITTPVSYTHLVAQSTVNEKIAAIKQALLEAGAKESEINTDSINIYANYDYSDNTEVIVGYTANNTLSVRTTDIDLSLIHISPQPATMVTSAPSPMKKSL